MHGCPFYGTRWPERSAILRQAQGAECGLDVDNNGPCQMEAAGHAVDYYSCALVLVKHRLLRGSERIIRLPADDQLITLHDWETDQRLKRTPPEATILRSL